MLRTPVVSIAVALLCGGASADWIPAFVANGSFELDTNRDAAPDGWQAATFESPAMAEWDQEVAHTGGASVRVDNSKHPEGTAWNQNSGRWVMAQSRECREGQAYTLRGWVKTELTEGHARLVFAWFADGAWLDEQGSEPVTGVTDWEEHSVTVTAPETADSVRVYLMLNGGVGSAWFDDVAMIAGDEAPGDYRPIDIREACTTGFRDDAAGDGQGGWTDQGPNDAREIPTGRQTWRGVPFEVVDPATNDDRSCIVLQGQGREEMPASAEVEVRQRCDVVYFLHGAGWAGPHGRTVARLVVGLGDGTEVIVPLRSGREVVDWWQPADTAESAIGWEGRNAESDSIALSIFPWVNPKPDVTVETVRIEDAGNEAIPILVAVTAGDGPPVLEERPLKLEFTDTTGWYEWAFALDDPTLDEIDLSFLLDAPAGKHGFLTVGEDGHFRFEDGTPIRFFGTNVVSSACCPEKRMAEIVAERLAKYGVNMLRLHVTDSGWGGALIDYSDGTSRRLSEENLDRHDYFVAQLIERGIYVYFDLLDYRKFLPGDGVRDAENMGVRWEHSIKGASIFDPRMIELQKEFATQVLTHKNPYTGRRYVDEPGLAVQEITNENSLFYLANTRLMLPSYVEDLRARWNGWLAEEYGGRKGLLEAWSRKGGDVPLLEDEDPGRGTVELPLQHLYADLRGGSAEPERNPARLNAMTRFLYELEVAYYDQMVEHLRSLGLKCPITGTNQDFSDASNRANARCDFMSRNNYWCHPNVDAKPYQRFRNLAVVNSDMTTTANPVANVASSTVVGKPMIVPEYNFPWPIEYRAECLPLMAAYGRLQDWDGLLFFCYHPDRDALGNFASQSDPVRWGQVPMAALTFLRGDIEVARNTVHVGVSETDTFATRQRRTSDHYSPYRVLPYISKVRNAYFDEVYEGDADVVISSGHSASGDYSKARRAIVFADEMTGEARRGASAEASVPGLKTIPIEPPLSTKLGDYDTQIDPATIPEGADLIEAAGHVLGFLTDRLYVMPSATGEGDSSWLHRAYLQAAEKWGLPSGAQDDLEVGRIFRSDTGQLALDRDKGVFTATSPNAAIGVGSLGAAGPVDLSPVTIDCKTPFASVSIVSLDGKPIAESGRLLLTAVARAENTGQAFLNNHTEIPEFGRPPVLAEPVEAVVAVRTARNLGAYPLSPRGEKQQPMPTTNRDGRVSVDVSGARSPWVLLEAE